MEALPDAIMLGRQIFNPTSKSIGSEGIKEMEPLPLWDRVSMAKFEILTLLVDSATVLLQALASASTAHITTPELGLSLNFRQICCTSLHKGFHSGLHLPLH
jgi:hypothetical protein